MAYLKITPGISALSDAGRILSADVHKASDELKAKVFTRDDNTCRYCGFQSRKYQEVNYIGKTDKGGNLDDYATACTFCYQCAHLERIDRMQSGAVIWLPEIGQAALHHLCRAIYVARISQGPMADAARDAMEALLARKEEAKNRLGTDSPKILATVLQDFLETSEYKGRQAKLKGFRVLPLDRRIIKEGDLEFNQFPQILAYWRSKDGPFGELPPRKWVKMFYDLKGQVSAAPLAAEAVNSQN
ncbi:MAG: type IV secretion protein DotN [Micavibrio sp.]|nr:type IV secretion protein DotN [Micavibrio sp.]